MTARASVAPAHSGVTEGAAPRTTSRPGRRRAWSLAATAPAPHSGKAGAPEAGPAGGWAPGEGPRGYGGGGGGGGAGGGGGGGHPS